MKVLVALLHCGLLRNFESVVERLAADGHEVVVAAEEEDRLGGDDLAARLAARWPRVTVTRVPGVGSDSTVDAGIRIRLLLDFLRFRDERTGGSAKLAERLLPRVPAMLKSLADRWGDAPASRWLSRLEAALPVNPALVQWLADAQPDVVVLGSLTHYRSLAPELHRAAAALKLPTVAAIYSWDHLSSKAQLRRVPETVAVWNESQAAEARELHSMPADIIEVTGAQCYDQWFTRAPSRDAATFRQAMGLEPARPHLLYVCSALTPNPDEPAFVRQWLRALRTSGHPVLQSIGVLIRPHPERVHEWDRVDLSEWSNVVLRGAAPVDAQSKNDYFDAIVHSSGVMGLVTSAFLEAAIADRPVFTITLPALAVHQTDMAHFRYLLEVADGLPAVATTFEAHVSQLAAVVDGDEHWRQRQRKFLEAFVRPGGLDAAATDRFVSVLHESARSPQRRGQPVVAPLPAVAARAALTLLGTRWARTRLRNELEQRHHQGLAQKAAIKRQKRSERRRRYVASVLRRLIPGGQPPASTG